MTEHRVPPPPVSPPPVPGPQPAGTTPMSPEAVRGWSVAAHLSSLVAAYVALGFLGPLTILLTVGQRDQRVRQEAVEALNFNLTWLLYIAVAGLLAFLLVGIPLLVALGIVYLVVVVLAAVRASQGGGYRYPLTLRLVR